MKSFEQIIKDKINSFEYPYNDNAWLDFSKKRARHKLVKTATLSSVVAIVILVTSYFAFFHQPAEQQSQHTTIKNDNFQEISVSSTLPSEQKSEQQHVRPTENHISHSLTNTKTIDSEPKQNNNTSTSTINQCQDVKVDQNSLSQNICVNTSKQKGCSPLMVTFVVRNIPDNALCYWSFGDGTVSNEKQPTHTYHKAGKYSPTLKIQTENKELTITDIPSIEVLPRPISKFTFSQHKNEIVFENKSKQYSSVKWILSDTTVFDETFSYILRKNCKSTVTLISENQYGCTDTASKMLDLTYTMPVQFADAFTPDGDGINDLFGPQVYDYSHFEFTLIIYNKNGRCVFESKGSPVWWDGTDKETKQSLPADVYFYKVMATDKSGNHQEFNGRIQLIK